MPFRAQPGRYPEQRGLSQFTARQSSDDVKRDLELTCDKCGEHLCDIEHGDSLAVLAQVALDHFCA